MILLNQVKLPLDTNFNNLLSAAAKELHTDKSLIKKAMLYKKSVDARHKENVHFCCSLLVETENDNRFVKRCGNAQLFHKKEYILQKPSKIPDHKPIVAGFGPAGMFAALTLARAGLKPVVIERGKDVDSRTADVNSFFKGGILDEESNVQFGEGGAGTFSDGKLNTGIKDIRCRYILENFVKFGAPDNILTDAKPHIGTDILVDVVKNIRKEIIRLGGTVHFGAKLDNIIVKNGKLCAISVNGDIIPCEYMITALGHSARDTLKMLRDNGISMEKKAFAMGVRIEHLQSEINRALYGDFYNHPALSAADYKLAVHLPNGRGVYTFCMCPGGQVINASSNKNGIAVNGMSYSRRDGKNANSALLVGINPEDFPDSDVLSGCALQQQIEYNAFACAKGNVPITTVGQFVYGKSAIIKSVIPTVLPKTAFADFNNIFPDFIINSLKEGIIAFDKKISGFANEDAILTAPETRSSSPVRILRSEDGASPDAEGIFPAGEGAGYAGGIMSAAADGIKAAEKIINKLQ